jgi:hypothetical protein
MSVLGIGSKTFTHKYSLSLSHTHTAARRRDEEDYDVYSPIDESGALCSGAEDGWDANGLVRVCICVCVHG